MTITDADREDAFNLAVEICGCANDEQRKRDVAALLAYRMTARREALEKAARYIQDNYPHDKRALVPAIRAMIEREG